MNPLLRSEPLCHPKCTRGKPIAKGNGVRDGCSGRGLEPGEAIRDGVSALLKKPEEVHCPLKAWFLKDFALDFSSLRAVRNTYCLALSLAV